MKLQPNQNSFATHFRVATHQLRNAIMFYHIIIIVGVSPKDTIISMLFCLSPPGGTANPSQPYSPSPPPPPPANYIPSASQPGGQAPPPSTAAPMLPPVADGRKVPGGPNMPINDARSDLLAAIRRGQTSCSAEQLMQFMGDKSSHSYGCCVLCCM